MSSEGGLKGGFPGQRVGTYFKDIVESVICVLYIRIICKMCLFILHLLFWLFVIILCIISSFNCLVDVKNSRELSNEYLP